MHTEIIVKCEFLYNLCDRSVCKRSYCAMKHYLYGSENDIVHLLDFKGLNDCNDEKPSNAMYVTLKLLVMLHSLM